MKMAIAGLHNGDRRIYWGRILLVSSMAALIVVTSITLVALLTGGTASAARLPADATCWTLVGTAFVGFAAGLGYHARTTPAEQLPDRP